MEPAILGPVTAEILKTWGGFGIVLLLLGAIVWFLRAALLAERKKSEALQGKIDELQAARLEDVRKLIQVTESSTQTAASRSQGDTAFLELFRKLIERTEAIEDRVTEMLPPPSPRPRHRSPR